MPLSATTQSLRTWCMLNLHDGDFDDIVKKTEIMLVDFYSPW